MLSPESILGLQRHVGNAIVTTLIQHAFAPVRAPGATVQRAPLPEADDPNKYTQPQGVKDVAKTGLTRLEVHGLKYGVSGGFQSDYGGRESAETKMTHESPDHMAVVIMPDKLDTDRPVQVVLHFHGWGFRQEKGAKDPYAGYLVASGNTASKKGDVRDVEQEHWEQQISAVVGSRSANQPQIVAILVQGRGKSEFGSFPTYGYVQEVFDKVTALGGIKKYSIVLSGHSGGGGTKIAPMVTGGDAQPADAGTLKKDPARAASQGPADLVVLFDAEGIEDTVSWATKQIAALGKALDADPQNAKAILAASPKFRGYFAKGGFYADRYKGQSKTLNEALKKIPPQWRDTTLPDVGVADLFRIIEVDRPQVSHEHIIGSTTDVKVGALADALTASLDPIADRGTAFNPLPAEPQKPAPKPASPPVIQRRPAIPEGAIPASDLGEYKSTAATRFRRQVYQEQLEQYSSTKAGEFTTGPGEEDLEEVEDGFKMHKIAAADCATLLARARHDRDERKMFAQHKKAAERTAADRLVIGAGNIGIASAHRSMSQDFSAWQNAFDTHYERTKDTRAALAGGEFGTAAVTLMVGEMAIKAIPGFSNHTKGLAVDFSTTQNGKDLGPYSSQKDDWRRSWFYEWLKNNAADHGFSQLPSEEWHWDHTPP